MNNYTFVFTFGSILLAASGIVLFALTMPHTTIDCILVILILANLFGVWMIDSKVKDVD